MSALGAVDSLPLDGSCMALVALLDDARLDGAPEALRHGASAVRAAEDARAQPWAPAATVDAAVTAARDAMLAGGAFPEGAVADVAAALAATAAADDARAAVVVIRNAVTSAFPALVARHLDALLASLRPILAAQVDRFAQLVEATSGLPLDDPTPFVLAPEAARQAYAQVSALAEDYAWLRTVQRVAYGAARQDASAYAAAWTSRAAEVRRTADRPFDPDERAHLLAAMAYGAEALWVPEVADMLRVHRLGSDRPADPPKPVVPMLVHSEPAAPAPRRQVDWPDPEPVGRGTLSDAAAHPNPVQDRLAAAATATAHQ